MLDLKLLYYSYWNLPNSCDPQMYKSSKNLFGIILIACGFKHLIWGIRQGSKMDGDKLNQSGTLDKINFDFQRIFNALLKEWLNNMNPHLR